MEPTDPQPATDNQPSIDLCADWFFLSEESGALTTRNVSWYGLPLLPGHEMLAMEVIVVGQIDPEKGYRIGNFGLN